jgi:predicted enzyme related to lactoylglutathione lyase
MTINGVHALIYTKQADAVRAFLRDVLEWPYVDAHEGWLIFAMPPAEVGVHPTDGASSQELWLMCDDLATTTEELRGKGVEVSDEQQTNFGRTATITLPDGSGLGLYQPRHASPLDL